MSDKLICNAMSPAWKLTFVAAVVIAAFLTFDELDRGRYMETENVLIAWIPLIVWISVRWVKLK